MPMVVIASIEAKELRHPGLDPGYPYLRQDASACHAHRLDLRGSRGKPGMTHFLSNTMYNIIQNAYGCNSLYRSKKAPSSRT